MLFMVDNSKITYGNNRWLCSLRDNLFWTINDCDLKMTTFSYLILELIQPSVTGLINRLNYIQGKLNNIRVIQRICLLYEF